MKSIAPKKLGLRENVRFTLRDEHGDVKKLFQHNKLGNWFGKRFGHIPKFFLFGSYSDELLFSNLVTNAGFAGVASRINGSGSEALFNYIAIGTGTTAAAAGDTTLETEITTGGGERAVATLSRVTTTQTDDTARLLNTFTFTSSFAVTESGVLNAASSGTLLARQVFAAINVVNTDNLQVTWDFDVSTA